MRFLRVRIIGFAGYRLVITRHNERVIKCVGGSAAARTSLFKGRHSGGGGAK